MVELNAEADVVKNNGTPCSIRLDEVTSLAPLNVSITGRYFTNYSSFVSVALGKWYEWSCKVVIQYICTCISEYYFTIAALSRC